MEEKRENDGIKQKQLFRKAVFVVTYKKVKKQTLYLVLKRKRHWKGWEIPKGGIEQNERMGNTVRRETYEESGLKSIGIRKFNFRGRYKYKRIYTDRPGYIGQSFVLFSSQVNEGKVKIDDHEHSAYLWLTFDQAIKKLRWNNQKKALTIVNDFLEKGKLIK